MNEELIVEVVKTLRDLMVEAGDSNIDLEDETGEYCVRVLGHGIQLCKDTENGFVEEMFLLRM
jgi:hypothetical protein